MFIFFYHWISYHQGCPSEQRRQEIEHQDQMSCCWVFWSLYQTDSQPTHTVSRCSSHEGTQSASFWYRPESVRNFNSTDSEALSRSICILLFPTCGFDGKINFLGGILSILGGFGGQFDRRMKLTQHKRIPCPPGKAGGSSQGWWQSRWCSWHSRYRRSRIRIGRRCN